MKVSPSLFSVLSVLLLALWAAFAADSAEAARPHLQIINGTGAEIEVFWLNPDGAKVLSGRVAPGRDHMISTTLGHRFLIAGKDGAAPITVTSAVPVQAFRYEPAAGKASARPAASLPEGEVTVPPDDLGIPSFYKKYISAGGYPIVASGRVNDYALKEAAWIAGQMLAHRPDVRKAMIASGSRMCIIAWNEFTTELPEFVRLEKVPGFEAFPAAEYWDARARGTGGSQTDPFCTCSEENLLGYPGATNNAESIAIHEFAHCIHLRGLVNVDATFDDRLKAVYDKAMAEGLWKGKYAAVNHHEYFAEGVQSWFDDNRENDHDHNHVNTRAELTSYDPRLAEICREVFGGTELKYTKPATRLTGHLAGYDPSRAPAFVWPERLAKVRAEIIRQARERDKKANAADGGDVRSVEGWSVHVSPQLLSAQKEETEHALELLRRQLAEIVEKVPAPAVAKLREVPLWFSPEYPGTSPRAEYHPDAGWLRDNKRNPAMARAVEFTNISIFEREVERMPNFALHELAHAFHDRVLSFSQPEIIDTFRRAAAGGTYEKVERRSSRDKPGPLDRAYAMTDHKEYFAETSEAFFSVNDFFPFNRDELRKHDPVMENVLRRMWGVDQK